MVANGLIMVMVMVMMVSQTARCVLVLPAKANPATRADVAMAELQLSLPMDHLVKDRNQNRE